VLALMTVSTVLLKLGVSVHYSIPAKIFGISPTRSEHTTLVPRVNSIKKLLLMEGV
jgi:hypothetical protein